MPVYSRRTGTSARWGVGLGAAGIGALILGLALFAVGGRPGRYHAGEAFSLVVQVPQGPAVLRVEKQSGPVPGGWLHAQYLPPGELLSVPLAPGSAADAGGGTPHRPLAIALNLWDPGVYRVTAGEGEGATVRVGLPASRFWGSVVLACVVWGFGLLAGWASRQVPRPGARDTGPVRRRRWASGGVSALVLLLLAFVAGGTRPVGATAGVPGASVAPAREITVLPLDALQAEWQGREGPFTLEVVHPEDGLLFRAPVSPGGVLRYRFPEGARYQVALGNARHWLDVPPVAPTTAEVVRGMAVLIAFFLAGGLTGAGLGLPRPTPARGGG